MACADREESSKGDAAWSVGAKRTVNASSTVGAVALNRLEHGAATEGRLGATAPTKD